MFRILILMISLIFSNESDVITITNPWGGYSVATSDDLDAFTFNPAGFAIDHGTQSGYYIVSDNNGNFKNSPFIMSSKTYGFGYSLLYNNVT